MLTCAWCRRLPLCWTLAIGLLAADGLVVAAPPAARPPDDGARQAAVEVLGRLPLLFVPELVGPDGAMGYVVRGHEASLWLNERGLTYRLHSAGEAVEGAAESWVVALDLVGAAPRPPVGRDPLGTRVSYFKGPKDQWRTGLEAYGSVVYREPWPGVDVVVSGTAGELESTFVVRPGADPRAIRLAYRGASAVSLNPDGGLTVETPLGPIDELAPVAWQEVDGRRVEVAAAFELEEGGEPGRQAYGFRIGAYDPAHELVVDPVTLVYCGYIGGTQSDLVGGAALDANGYLYVTGCTNSDEASFPVKVGPEVTYDGAQDVFVAKVSPDGSGLEYCGYIGGTGWDAAIAISVDAAGSAYVAGHTQTDDGSFPVTVGPDLTFNGGDWDSFVAKVSPDGSNLEYCGYIGGEADDGLWSIGVDASGRAHVVGESTSTEATFPVLVGPDVTHNGANDGFVARVNAAGTGLEYCGYVGGELDERIQGMDLDVSGSVYVVGHTESNESTFPVIVGPDLTHNDLTEAFVAKVSADGTFLEYCGYIGGSGIDRATAVAVDTSGRAYVTGYTTSTEATFPALIGPDLTHNGVYDAFVVRVGASGESLERSGYIGGLGVDYGCDIALDAVGHAYIVGVTASTETTFPVQYGPDLTYNGGSADAFVAQLSVAGDALDYCGYIGGSGSEIFQPPWFMDLAVDAEGHAFVTGTTLSSEATFPVAVGPDLTINGEWDGFVAKVSAMDLLFTDGFESGDTSRWSATVP